MPLTRGNLPKLKNRKQSVLRIDSPGKKGKNSLSSETRLDKEHAKETTDLILVEDGVLQKRWGTQQYGPTFTAIDGFHEYVKSDGTRELIVIDNGTAYRTTTTTKTAITGASFTAGNRCFFLQSQSYLYIGNGVDYLTRYDGSTLSRYTEISAPAWGGTPLARGAGLSAGSFTYYYQITSVNDVGETTANAEQSITVDIDRDLWSAADELITLDWDAVAGANKYIIYFTDVSGYEVKLAEVTGATTWDDTGANAPNTYIAPPDTNSTGGPKLKSMAISNNRIWGTEPDNPYTVYYSGTGTNLGNFAPGFGGGWVQVEVGSRAYAEAVVDYQGTLHTICSTPEGRGTVWEINLTSIEVGSTSVIVAIPNKIIPSNGTNSPLATLIVENDVLFPNKKGIQVLGNEPNILNVLRTNEVSSSIRPYFEGLTQGRFDQIAGYYYDAKVFFSVPQADSANNDRIIVLDRERKAWIADWTVGVNQFGEFTDSSGVTHFLGSQATKLVEFSESYEDDDGTAFTPTYVSPRIPVHQNWTAFARIKRAYARLRNVTGTVLFQFSGTAKNENTTTLASGTISPASSDTGMGWDPMGSVQMGDTAGVPTAYATESLLRYLVVNKLIRDFQFTVKTNGGSTDKFTLTGLMAKGSIIPTGEPSGWKLS